jgi:hypothetical protein
MGYVSAIPGAIFRRSVSKANAKLRRFDRKLI